MFVISLYHILCNFCNRMLFKFQLVSLMPLRNESELYLFQHDVELFIPLPWILHSAVSVSTENFWWQAHGQFALSVLRDSKFMSQTNFFKMQFIHLMVHLSIYISKKVIKFKQSFLVKNTTANLLYDSQIY